MKSGNHDGGADGEQHDDGADPEDAPAQTLADLRRSDDVVRMRLEGLSDLEVSEFVRRVTEGRTSAELPEISRAISNLTGGNAFLMCELWRAVVETDVIADGGDELRLAGSLLAQLETRAAQAQFSHTLR